MPHRTPDEEVVLLLNVDSHRKIWSLPQGTADLIASRFPRARILRVTSASALREQLPLAEILYTWSLPRDLFPLARRLRWIHTPAAGVDHLLYPSLRQSKVILTNSRGIAADAMADHVFALILALARRVPDAVRHQAAQRWGQDAMWATEPAPIALSGKTLGIVGLGGVGNAIAKRGRAFGMRVIASRKSPPGRSPGIARMFGRDQLGELLEESDVVVLTVPLTSETRSMIGAKELRRMKRSAYLVNVGRGEQVDESALIRALREGAIAGAALDVFQREPLPKNSVLWRVPRLLVSPHYAGTYPEHMARATSLFLENLALYLSRGRRQLKNTVDKERGY